MRRSLWDGRVEDFEAGDVIIATCARCGHQAYIPHEEIVKRVTTDRRNWRGIFAWTKVKDLKDRLRCTRCPVPLNSRPHRDIEIRVTNDGDRVRRK